MFYKYILSDNAITEIKKEISSSLEAKTSFMKVLNVGERQVKNILNSNHINGILTSRGSVNWILDNTCIRTESKILKEVR